ncbi:DUF2806 domain-containing protein [bacterium]|nr:DUF2806 domain-containing protein [bacterium]
MSEIKGVEIHDVLGISEPFTKLIETVSGGIGKLYEPIHIKRMAKAKAEEVKIIGEKISDFNALPIKYDSGKVMIDGTDFSELAKRANGRLVFQELKKQNNIDNVVGYAAQDLSNEKVVSEQPVDIDWVTRFFDSVSDVSSEDMQRIWGKILAGEVKRPGTFSLRTLQVIKNINKEEAKLFEKIAPFVMSCHADKDKTFFDSFLFAGKIMNKYGIYFPDIMRLNDAGLLYENAFINVGFELMPNEKDCFFGRGKKIEVTNIDEMKFHLSCSAYVLTEAGKELLPIVLEKCASPAKEYFSDCFNEIQHTISQDLHGAYKIEIVDCEV